MPRILSTIPSPLQYAYRTKLTPHFDAPPKSAREGSRFTEKPDWLHIEFNRIGAGGGMDMEEEVKEAYEVVKRIDVLDVSVG